MAPAEFIRSAGNTFFSVRFVKKSTGTVRQMVCQFREMEAGRVRVVVPRVGYRSFLLHRVLRLTSRGKTIEQPSAKRFLLSDE